MTPVDIVCQAAMATALIQADANALRPSTGMLCYNSSNNNNNQDDYGAVIMAHNRESLSSSFDECRLSARWLPTHRPNQPTWDMSPLVGCYRPHPLSPFIII